MKDKNKEIQIGRQKEGQIGKKEASIQRYEIERSKITKIETQIDNNKAGSKDSNTDRDRDRDRDTDRQTDGQTDR